MTACVIPKIKSDSKLNNSPAWGSLKVLNDFLQGSEHIIKSFRATEGFHDIQYMYMYLTICMKILEKDLQDLINRVRTLFCEQN